MPKQNPFRNINQRLQLFIASGEWALALPQESRRNLSRYWFDGLFAAASDTIPINYLTLYLLAVGANSSQVGLFSSLTSLAAAASLLPGALLVERYGHRKEITVLFGGIMARVALLFLALLPLGFSGQVLIWAVILLSTVRSALGNLAFPAWMSITGDIVPLEGRGRYFGSRNFVMCISALVMTYLVGEFITRIGSPHGYQISLALAFVVGMFSTWSFSRIKDQQPERHIHSPMLVSLPEIWKDLRASPIFLSFCFASALWNFSINIAGPFFNVHMVQDLKFTAAMVGITAVSTSITKMLIQPQVGKLSDRWGPGKVQVVCMFLMPSLPLAWIFITQLWQVVLLNIFGGVLWGAFELVSFNFLLQLTPDTQRARYSAIFQIIVTLALAGGAALGASIIYWWGYSGIFLTSAIGRAISALFFVRLVRNLPKHVDSAGQSAAMVDSAESL
ncbi:MAG: MFS transporter [Chloroflexi bacterium]|nr:MFS transporter [Chloroflexota bacterium]